MAGRLKEFLSYVEEYFRGPTGRAEYRELFLCRGDPGGSGFRTRGGVWVGGLGTFVSTYIRSARSLSEWNVYMGIGYWSEPGLFEPVPDRVLYDRLCYDFDSGESPAAAVSEALGFANLLYREYGVKPLVFETGFKGAHVVAPLSEPVDWDGYQLLWRHLYESLPLAVRRMVDLNMLQWNRVDRVPLTYNVKKGDTRFCRIVYPREFAWSDFRWSELDPLEPRRVTVVRVVGPEVVRPRTIMKVKEREWIWEVVRRGLPDGRRRFMLMVLIPYLAVVKRLPEEEILRTCMELVENSCKNLGNCDKVYDSWIRSVVRSTRRRDFGGFGLRRLKEKDPELYALVVEAVGRGEDRGDGSPISFS